MTDAPDFDSAPAGDGGEDQGVAPEQGNQPSGGNPAWGGIQSQLDPISWSKIQPELQKFETNAQKAREAANRWNSYQGIIGDRTPDLLQRSIGFAEMLDSQPQAIYERLGQYLQQQGLLEQQAEEDEGDEDGSDDPRLSQLEQAQQQMLQMMQSQQFEAASRQADAELDTTLSQLRRDHPELQPQDIQEIVQRAAFVAQQNPGQNIDFSRLIPDIYGQYAEFVNRIRSAPRASDSAPNLAPISGGVPSAPNQNAKSLGQYSSSDIQDFIAQQLMQQRGGA